MRNRAFQRALLWSAGAHAAILLLIIVNPSLPKSGPKGEIRYISLGLGGGGGGNGGGGGGGGSPAGPAPEEKLIETPLPKPQLRDLTTAAKAETAAKLRYPSEKTKPNRRKPAPEKTTSVTRPEPGAKTAKTGSVSSGRTSTGGSGGAGLTIGGGSPGFGEGTGLGGYGDQIGMGDFPFAYYLQIIRDRISARWFQSLVDPGVTGTFRSAVYFRIFRNGSISKVEVKEPSGLRALDMSAQRAVTDASPFPPLPDDYDEEYLGIILIFEHVK